MKSIYIVVFASLMTLFSGCSNNGGLSTSSFGKNVKRDYYTGGMLRSEFIMDDNTEMNGVRKEYGYDGKLTSTVLIRNGVKYGTEKWFDPENRVILAIPYVDGRKHGTQTAYYPNGQPMITIPFSRGMKNGTAVAYKRDGSVYKTEKYQNDRRIY